MILKLLRQLLAAQPSHMMEQTVYVTVQTPTNIYRGEVSLFETDTNTIVADGGCVDGSMADVKTGFYAPKLDGAHVPIPSQSAPITFKDLIPDDGYMRRYKDVLIVHTKDAGIDLYTRARRNVNALDIQEECDKLPRG